MKLDLDFCCDKRVLAVSLLDKRMITVYLPEKEALSKELSMSMQLGWVKN